METFLREDELGTVLEHSGNTFKMKACKLLYYLQENRANIPLKYYSAHSSVGRRYNIVSKE